MNKLLQGIKTGLENLTNKLFAGILMVPLQGIKAVIQLCVYFQGSCSLKDPTERFIYYRKPVLYLLKRMFYVRLSRCSTDVR